MSFKTNYFLINKTMTCMTDDPSIKSLKNWLVRKGHFNSKDEILSVERLSEEQFDYFNTKLLSRGRLLEQSFSIDYY